MDSFVRPHSYVALRLPSGLHRVINVVPDTVVSLGKFGSFNTNALLDRPFYLTYEVLDRPDDLSSPHLRVVPAEEIHAEVLSEDLSTAESRDDAPAAADDTEVVEQDGAIVVRDNRQTVDDPSRQTLSAEEIEELKKSATGSGRNIVSKIMESHSAIGEKTAYSLAKYIVRKARKYMKRFTLLPLDVSMLAEWIVLEKDATKVLEIREEMLGLVASWANVHFSIPPPLPDASIDRSQKAGRWLVVEDAAGLFVALLAERMGILHPPDSLQQDVDQSGDEDASNTLDAPSRPLKRDRPADEMDMDGDNEHADRLDESRPPYKKHRPAPDPAPADYNSITLVHTASQPNVSLLSYFSFEPNTATSNVATPAHDHPLYNNLKTLSWLQLLAPEDDSAYQEPEKLPEEALEKLKSAKRGAYHRKRRRWERARQIIDETRAGGFDGLVVASAMDPAQVFHHLVPLLRGGAPIVAFSPTAEPLAELADLYSSARRTAYINALYERPAAAAPRAPCPDFPVDPRLVLAPALQTARAREWQVLPGRTHPLMTSMGGPEGYLFTGIRAIPSEDRAEARGVFAKKKRKTEEAANGAESPAPLDE